MKEINCFNLKQKTNMSKKIVVVGSANMDMVVKSERFPKSGETILGGDFFLFKGGKGANQAVAAARLGGEVFFICKVGDDDFGRRCINYYKSTGINTDHILIDQEHATGVAMILVNGEGENKIVVAPGANSMITRDEIVTHKSVIIGAGILVLQLEIPLEIIGQILKLSKKYEIKVVLNPAPARSLPEWFYDDLFLITPNETEASQLTGIKIEDEDSVLEAAKRLKSFGVKNVVITMGDRGAFALTEGYTGFISANNVKVIDTTAAGDVFNGALSVALTLSKPWKDAVVFANRAATLSVSKNGAQNSAPTIEELRNFASTLGMTDNP